MTIKRATREKEVDMNVESLNNKYLERLSELYDSERQLLRALPAMGEACCSYRVKELLERRLSETPERLARLDRIFSAHETRPGRVKATATRALLSEAQCLMEDEVDLEQIDAGLVELAQRLDGEVSTLYETARDLGHTLGDKLAVKLLQKSIAEEGESSASLQHVQERYMPVPAMAG